MSETTRTYELGYLLVPTVPEAQVESTVQTLLNAITAAGATIVSTGNPEFIDLEYTMEKSVASKTNRYNQAYFGWIKFDTDPETVESLKKAFDSNHDLIRYLLVKTSAQNMVIFRKPKNEAVREVFADDVDALLDDTDDESLKEDHEKLPDLQDDVVAPSTDAIIDETADHAGTQAATAEESEE
jgi:ribosomal protein S6